MWPELLAAAWAIAFVVASRVMPAYFGRTVIGGMERWRDAWSLPTQYCLLPLALLIHWCGIPGADRYFVYVLTLYMAMDPFLAGQQDSIVYVHHVFCLLGHAIVCAYLGGDAFDTYFKGVVVLELGSGSMNIWLLDHASRRRAAFFAVVMSTSNFVACAVGVEWARLPMAMAPKVACLVIAGVLIVMRQQACVESLRLGPAELRINKQAANKPTKHA